MLNQKNGKVSGCENEITEILKFMGAEGLRQLTKLMNKIVVGMKIPKVEIKSIILSIYKKENNRNCNNYKGITLSSISRYKDTRPFGASHSNSSKHLLVRAGKMRC